MGYRERTNKRRGRRRRTREGSYKDKGKKETESMVGNTNENEEKR